MDGRVEEEGKVGGRNDRQLEDQLYVGFVESREESASVVWLELGKNEGISIRVT